MPQVNRRYMIENFQPWGKWSSEGWPDSHPSIDRARAEVVKEMETNPDIQWWDGVSEPEQGDTRIVEEIVTRSVVELQVA